MDREPRVGVGVIIRRGDEVLLIHRAGAHGAGSWSTPGGHLEYGETPEQCAVREAREETGVEVRDVRFRAITNDVFEAEGLHYVTIWMEGDYGGGKPAVTAGREASRVGWFRWNQLPAPLFLPFRNLLAGPAAPSGTFPPGRRPAPGS